MSVVDAGYTTRARGLSSLEGAVVLVIVGLLMVVFMERTLRLQARIEHRVLEHEVNQLNAVMAVLFAERVVNRQLAGIQDLQGFNPMEELVKPPPGYLGVLEAPDVGSLPKGSWYYDAREGVLVYMVRNGEYFQSSLREPPRARFRTTLVFGDVDGDRRYTPGTDLIQGVRVLPLEPYAWTAG